MMTVLTQAWAERLGWTLLHFLWQGTLIASFYALARTLAGPRLSASARYTLSCASLLAMALAPAATYAWLSGSPIPAAGVVHTLLPATPATGPSAPLDPAGFWQLALPWIVLAWFAGVAACSARLASGWIAAAALRRRATRPAPPEWRQVLDRLMARMQVTRTVGLVVSERVESPSVVGWLRPVILTPAAAACGLAPEHLEALLAHELAHIRRHDYLVNVLQGFVESLLFYHPAVWWMSGQIRAEREHCCDDLAVAASGDVLVYARALAELESARPAHCRAALAAADGSLLHRIRRLVGPAPSNSPAGSGAAWALSVLLLLAIGGAAVRAADTQPQPPVVELKTVWPDTVKQGNLELQVRGLGKLTSTTTARIQVAETQMKGVRVGLPVVVDLRRTPLIPGTVSSIASAPANGTVAVDVQLSGSLPEGVEPPAQVDGLIKIGSLANVVYVGRPVFGRANSEVVLFKIEPGGKSALRVKVTFGAASVNLIEIKSGLQPGDQVILSDMSKYDNVSRVELR